MAKKTSQISKVRPNSELIALAEALRSALDAFDRAILKSSDYSEWSLRYDSSEIYHVAKSELVALEDDHDLIHELLRKGLAFPVISHEVLHVETNEYD